MKSQNITPHSQHKITSDHLKVVVASYYRFDRQFPYVCTEFDFMDVCACDEKNLIEVECKISKSDLKKEFEKDKHEYYNGNKHHKRVIVPNYYYICITDKMSEDKEVIDIINKLNPMYGIYKVFINWLGQYELYPIKGAKKLHDKKVYEDTIKKICKRLSSENIALRNKKIENDEDKKILKKNIKILSEEIENLKNGKNKTHS